MAHELPIELHEPIDRLAEQGNTLMERGSYVEAEAVFREGLEMLPPPLERWSATLWFLTSIGDAQWMAADHQRGIDTWRDAILYGGLGNPFVHLRRGQTLFELGHQDEAADELLRALLIAGAEIFAGEPSIYWEFITTVAKPPEGCSSWDGFPGVSEESPMSEWLYDPSQYKFMPKELE